MTAPSASTPATTRRPRTPAQRIRLAAYLLATVIVLSESIAGAQWDLSRNDYVRDTFAHLGYPLYLLTILGVWKLLGILAIAVPGFPRLKQWAYAGMFLTYSGAFLSHLAVGDPASAWAGPLGFAAITLVSWALWPWVRRTPAPNVITRLFARFEPRRNPAADSADRG